MADVLDTLFSAIRFFLVVNPSPRFLRTHRSFSAPYSTNCQPRRTTTLCGFWPGLMTHIGHPCAIRFYDFSLLFSDFCWLYSHRPFVGASAPISRVAFFTLIRYWEGLGPPKGRRRTFVGHAGKSRWLISGEWFLMLCIFFLRDHKGFMGDEMTRRYDAVLLSGLVFCHGAGEWNGVM